MNDKYFAAAPSMAEHGASYKAFAARIDGMDCSAPSVGVFCQLTLDLEFLARMQECMRPGYCVAREETLKELLHKARSTLTSGAIDGVDTVEFWVAAETTWSKASLALPYGVIQHVGVGGPVPQGDFGPESAPRYRSACD